MTPTHRYAQAQNETASPERLMVLLFEAALRHMRSGAAALEQQRAADANEALSKAAEIVVHLHSTFDPAQAPELAGSVGAVYEFVSQRLISANLKRDAALVHEAERVFAPVAEAFAQAVQLAKAQAAGTP